MNVAARLLGVGRLWGSALGRSVSVCSAHMEGNSAMAVAGVTAMLAEVAMRLLEPWPVRAVVDAVAPAAVDGAEVAPGIERTLLIAAAATIAIVAARAAAAFFSTVAFAVIGSRVTTRLRSHVYDHVLDLSMRFHDRTRPGDLVVRLTGDVQRLQEVTVSAALPLVANAVLFVGMLTVMVVLDPILALSVIVVAPLFLVSGRRSSAKITGASRTQRKTEGAIASVAAESLSAMKLVHSYGLGPQLARSFESSNESSFSSGVKARRLAAGLERRTDVIVGFATAAVLYMGARRVISGSLSPGELVVFLTYLKTAFKPMRDVAKQTGRIARAAASGERIADLLDIPAEIEDRAGARPIPAVYGDIRFSEVTLGYDHGEPVLRRANLHIRPGERVAVIGESGAGKSTLVSAILRLVEPTAGAVLIDGHDIRDVTSDSLRANMAVVLQESVLFATTIAENIRSGRPGASDAEVWAAARDANAAEFIAALPEGIETVVGQRGATLSGGQRQRIAVARAILRDAPIVLLDEPTTGLDHDGAHEVMVGLDRLVQGRTTVIVAHDPMLTLGCDKVLQVGGGAITEVGVEAPAT